MKTKNVFILICIIAAGLIIAAGTAHACLSDNYFSESYLDGKKHADLEEGMKLQLKFDLVHKNGKTVHDAYGFIPGFQITSAVLSLVVSDWDRAKENLIITTGKKDGGIVLFDSVLTLNRKHPVEHIEIDLLEAGLANYIADGRLTINIFAPEMRKFDNDFRLDHASLVVVTEAPLPASLLLFGSGLAGIAGLRRLR